MVVRFSIPTPMYLRNEPQIGLERPQVRGIYKFILTRLAALQMNCWTTSAEAAFIVQVMLFSSVKWCCKETNLTFEIDGG